MSVENWINLLVPLISIVVAIVSAGLSYYFAKRLQVNADERRLKEEHYKRFIEALSRNTIDDEKTSVDNLVVAINQMPLICSSKVAIALESFKYYTARQNTNREIDKDNQLLTELLKAMREDLYGDKVNKDFPTITLQGNKGVQNETTI